MEQSRAKQTEATIGGRRMMGYGGWEIRWWDRDNQVERRLPGYVQSSETTPVLSAKLSISRPISCAMVNHILEFSVPL